jgi:hypothetical protein
MFYVFITLLNWWAWILGKHGAGHRSLHRNRIQQIEENNFEGLGLIQLSVAQQCKEETHSATEPQSMIFAQQAKTLTSALVHSQIAVQKMPVLNPIISAIIHSDICFYQKLHSHGGAFDHLQANLFISGRYSANCMLQLLAKKQKNSLNAVWQIQVSGSAWDSTGLIPLLPHCFLI